MIYIAALTLISGSDQPLIPMSPITHPPLPEKEAAEWERFLNNRPAYNLEVAKEHAVPWRSFALFFALFFSIPPTLWLAYSKILLPLSYKSPKERALDELNHLKREQPTKEVLFNLSTLLKKYYENQFSFSALNRTQEELENELRLEAALPTVERHIALLKTLHQARFQKESVPIAEIEQFLTEAKALIKEASNNTETPSAG